MKTTSSMAGIDRRDFIRQGAATVVVTSACLCGLGACATYTGVGRTPPAATGSFTLRDGTLTIDLEKEPRLDGIGEAVKIVHPALGDGLIIAHVEEDRFEIVSLLCTHRGVEVEYDHQRGRFQCASLGSSAFSMDGRNLSGPAGRPLRHYEATLESGLLTIGV